MVGFLEIFERVLFEFRCLFVVATPYVIVALEIFRGILEIFRGIGVHSANQSRIWLSPSRRAMRKASFKRGWDRVEGAGKVPWAGFERPLGLFPIGFSFSTGRLLMRCRSDSELPYNLLLSHKHYTHEELFMAMF